MMGTIMGWIYGFSISRFLIIYLLSVGLEYSAVLATNSSTVTSSCGLCLNNGICNHTTSKCICFGDYYGDTCDKVEHNKEREYDCKDGGCQHEGVCLSETGECFCIRPYYGYKCQHMDSKSWINNPKQKDNEKSILVSVSLGVIFINAVCFVVICVSMRRNKRRQDDDELEELSEQFVQVEGPPQRRVTGRRRSSGFDYRPSWYLPFHEQSARRASRSREGPSGLHPVSTAPAMLEGGMPPKYGHVTLLSESSDSSFATIQGTRLNSIPPGYEEAGEYGKEPPSSSSPRGRLSTSSGIYIRCHPSTSDAGQRLPSVSEAALSPYEEEDDIDDESGNKRTSRITSIAFSQCSSVFAENEEDRTSNIVELETGC
ncbi:uncharacterized protein LOC144357836 [Saccoglossus kowalevskii]